MQSKNGFLGREEWVFDPNLGTPSEHAEVERLRQEFTKNRFHKKESQDLLLRMQYANLNKPGANVPVSRLEENAEVTEEIVLGSLRRAMSCFSILQAEDGHWPGDYSGLMYITPLWVFALYVTGTLNVILSTEHIYEICRYIYNHQNEDGGWGNQVLSPSTMFGSCMNYTTLRLLGQELHGKNNALAKGRAWILSHGTATAAPQWAKIFLSIIGAYDWSGNTPIIPELWMVPTFLPIYPGRFWCYTRIVYMAMAYICGKKFVGPITPTIFAIREELYDIPYNEIDWSKACDTCAKEDIIYPRSLMQNVARTCLNKFIEPLFTCWPFSKLRDRALNHLMERIHYEDETTQYVGLGSVTKALNMICCWIENADSDAFKKHLPRIFDYLWISEDGMKSKVVDGCQCWETSFIVQAFCSTNLVNEFSSTLQKAYLFIRNSQVVENPPGDQNYWHRHISRGSWTLSTTDSGWSVSDCTAEALKALLLLPKSYPNLVEELIGEERLLDAADCLLSFMNKDGSFSTYERKRTGSWVEILNPSESFRNIVADYPSVECTSSVIQALVLFRESYPNYRSNDICECVKKAARFIENSQQIDGSWYGTWGICFTYGTFFAVKGLLAAGRTYENSYSIKKACDFLLLKQLNSGGWGESYLSCVRQVYVQGDCAHAVNTAWAMLALLYAGQIDRDPAPLHHAAKELINIQMQTGEFPQQGHVGNFNSSMYFNYPNYRNLFPIWALGEYHRRFFHRREVK